MFSVQSLLCEYISSKASSLAGCQAFTSTCVSSDVMGIVVPQDKERNSKPYLQKDAGPLEPR